MKHNVSDSANKGNVHFFLSRRVKPAKKGEATKRLMAMKRMQQTGRAD